MNACKAYLRIGSNRCNKMQLLLSLVHGEVSTSREKFYQELG